MLRGDFHIHTKYSGDSKIEINDLLEKARKLNFDFLGVTDHNSTKGGIEAKKISKDILVLVGQEVRTEKGELIVFGTEEDLAGTLEEILEIAKERDLFVLLPHPFDKLRGGAVGNHLSEQELLNLENKIDAIEVFNSRCVWGKFNKKAQKFSEDNQIPGVAGSDSHNLEEIGNAVNFLNCDKTEEEILRAIKQNKVTWSAKKTNSLNYLRKLFLIN